MRLFKGDVGRWFTVEWLPPHLLVAAIIPLSMFWKVPPDGFAHALGHVLGAGDLLAISFCLTFSSIGTIWEASAASRADGLEKSYYIEAQTILLIVVMLLTYAGVKINPIGAQTGPERIGWYVTMNIVVMFWVSGLIYFAKAKA